MCGITGVLSSSPVAPETVDVMRDQLTHRGPDHGGTWRSADGRVCLGHRRLAIVDLNPEANQPFHSGDGRFVIVFNGEIYNFVSLREELTALGAVFRTRSDTEVLVEAYRFWGGACLGRLEGMFAFAIWDSAEHTLFAARDRAGEKPFYYAEVGGAFVFGSELKALVAYPGFPRRVSFPAVADFLTYAFIPDPKTIYERALKLPPGHSLSVRCLPGAAPQVERPAAYWDFAPAPDRSVKDFGDEVRATLEDVSLQMSFADVKVGTFLSGGVDSSSVTAALARRGVGLTAYTIGFEEDGYDERHWAKQVVDRYGTPWRERTVGHGDVPQVFQDLAFNYDEPFGDYSSIPTYYLCREARRDVTVALSGDGADEAFAGYRKYQRLAKMEAVFSVPGSRLALSVAGGAVARLAGNLAPRTLHQYTSDPERALSDMLTLGLNEPSLRAAAAGPLASALVDYRPHDVVVQHLRRLSGEGLGLVDRMRYLDLKLTLAGGILTKVDRASMAVSLEVRPVYLHPRLLALAARVPESVLVEKGSAKAVLKRALEPWLPQPLLNRRKMGFHMPLGRWMNAKLDALTNAASRSPHLEAWFGRGVFDRLLQDHRQGRADHTATLHNLLVLHQWAERWNPTG